MMFPPFLITWAWALLHFLWQGLLLAGLAALLFALFRTRSPQLRYRVGLSILLLSLLCPFLTWWVLSTPLPAEWTSAALPPHAGAAPTELPSATSAGWRPLLSQALPWLLCGWLVGVGLLSLRLIGGWCWLQRLRRRMVPLEARWEARLAHLARRMGLRVSFRAGVSGEITSPLVMGWMRPVLLLPARMLMGMDEVAIEALMAHELAHLKRHDVFFNWLQCAAEVLLFYHPAIRWLSRRTRLERECACDDLAVAACGDALSYAEALNQLDDLQSFDFIPAQAAHGENLMFRIQRLLTPPTQPRVRLSLALPALALAGAGAFALSAHAPTRAPHVMAPIQESTASQPPAAHPAPTKGAGQKTVSEKPTPKANDWKEETLYHRKITFALWVNKEGGHKLDLTAEYATRAEVEEALRRIETLIKPRAGEGVGNGSPSSGTWELKPMKNADDLLRFRLNQVSIPEARQLF